MSTCLRVQGEELPHVAQIIILWDLGKRTMARSTKLRAARIKLIPCLINTHQTTCKLWQLTKEYTFGSEVILCIKTTFKAKHESGMLQSHPQTTILFHEWRRQCRRGHLIKKLSSNLTTRHMTTTIRLSQLLIRPFPTGSPSTLLELQLQYSSSSLVSRMTSHTWNEAMRNAVAATLTTKGDYRAYRGTMGEATRFCVF